MALCSAVLLSSCGQKVDPHYEITRDIYGVTYYKIYTLEYEPSDFEFDSHGNLISAKEGIHKYTFTYDDQNRMIKTVLDKGMYGVTTGEVVYNPDGTVKEYKWATVNEGKTDKSSHVVIDYVAGVPVKAMDDSKVITFTTDEYGRITYRDRKDGSVIDREYEYTYNDGTLNPDTRAEIHRLSAKTTNGYGYAISYDERGNRMLENVVDLKGEKSKNIYTYDVIGEVTESPETNTDLITRDQWSYFKDNKAIPIPSSCIRTISESNDEHIFLLPTARGSFFYLWLGYDDWYDPANVEGSYAFTAVDQYLNILTDVCGLEVSSHGNVFLVSKDGKQIADLTVILDPSAGYLIKVEY